MDMGVWNFSFKNQGIDIFKAEGSHVFSNFLSDRKVLADLFGIPKKVNVIFGYDYCVAGGKLRDA